MGETDTFTRLFESNRNWARSTASSNPDLFPTLAAGQQPEILWIGCADSRCPETTVLGLQPGDVFVARNIANIVNPTDLNLNAVIEYAVVYLKVKHIIVCGHTSCGGVAAALGNKKLGLIDTWLLPLRSLRQAHLSELQEVGDKQAALKLVELNIQAGIAALQQNDVVIDAVSDRGLKLHGLIYDVGKGNLRELEIHEPEEVMQSRQMAFKTSV